MKQSPKRTRQDAIWNSSRVRIPFSLSLCILSTFHCFFLSSFLCPPMFESLILYMIASLFISDNISHTHKNLTCFADRLPKSLPFSVPLLHFFISLFLTLNPSVALVIFSYLMFVCPSTPVWAKMLFVSDILIHLVCQWFNIFCHSLSILCLFHFLTGLIST